MSEADVRDNHFAMSIAKSEPSARLSQLVADALSSPPPEEQHNFMGGTAVRTALEVAAAVGIGVALHRLNPGLMAKTVDVAKHASPFSEGFAERIGASLFGVSETPALATAFASDSRAFRVPRPHIKTEVPSVYHHMEGGEGGGGSGGRGEGGGRFGDRWPGVNTPEREAYAQRWGIDGLAVRDAESDRFAELSVTPKHATPADPVPDPVPGSNRFQTYLPESDPVASRALEQRDQALFQELRDSMKGVGDDDVFRQLEASRLRFQKAMRDLEENDSKGHQGQLDRSSPSHDEPGQKPQVSLDESIRDLEENVFKRYRRGLDRSSPSLDEPGPTDLPEGDRIRNLQNAYERFRRRPDDPK